MTSNAPAPLTNYTASLAGTAQDVLVYFGGETIQEGSYGSTLSLSYVTADRLGSMPGGAKLDPYGQELSATANDKIKFATYLRDGESGIDYAEQRYYNQAGRFFSPDPGGLATANPRNPGSWNRYAYTKGDPVNHYDPTGTDDINAGCAAFDDAFCDGSALASNDPMNTGVSAPPGMVNVQCSAMYGLSYVPMPGVAACTVSPEQYDDLVDGPPEIDCFAQLKDRPVDDPKAKKVNAVHTFWWVQDSTGTQYIISGYPTSPDSSGNRFLNVTATPGATNGTDSSSAHTDWSSGLSWMNCDQVDAMVGAAKDWQNNHNNTIAYNPIGALGIGGPNSNSAAHYFGVVSGFNPNPPTTAYGWWSPIVFP